MLCFQDVFKVNNCPHARGYSWSVSHQWPQWGRKERGRENRLLCHKTAKIERTDFNSITRVSSYYSWCCCHCCFCAFCCCCPAAHPVTASFLLVLPALLSCKCGLTEDLGHLPCLLQAVVPSKHTSFLSTVVGSCFCHVPFVSVLLLSIYSRWLDG